MTKGIRKMLMILALSLFSVSLMSYVMLNDVSVSGPTAMASFDMDSSMDAGEAEYNPCDIPLCMGILALVLLGGVMILKKLE